MNNSDTRSVPNRLFFRLFQTGNVLQRQVQKEMGISTVQWAVLGALSREGHEGGISFFELTEYLVVSRQSLDGVLKRMERDNHVLRVPHPDDGRARLVQLTDTGKAFWDSLQDRIQAFYQQGLQSFSFDDGISLLHFLNKLQGDMAAISLGNAEQDDEAQ
ncbi:MarR family winged helix-turn-helix transcriptional regulator [Pseudomonas chlororaphis]|jgi:DNA-binding MarR family transcriptional regulator|uniref:MarR family winged helix-turn-helix transcriptional regulator n=2 Tax=Pseudomonas chlororaphis TaxID=587753 RepID=UPI001B311C32|nr:MarR family transcriptional regulator [Pseudomonas chlororaphis]MBP5059218.1 MarR family transcriptional regulator [Pseudomonas chlororaphis]MBP5137960.1 MarR family transcriptional regulator [Pseudomonas chlororaphis]QTT98306.1 MarR family transcriptional regulator [Pseudomonas chlororaphis]